MKKSKERPKSGLMMKMNVFFNQIKHSPKISGNVVKPVEQSQAIFSFFIVMILVIPFFFFMLGGRLIPGMLCDRIRYMDREGELNGYCERYVEAGAGFAFVLGICAGLRIALLSWLNGKIYLGSIPNTTDSISSIMFMRRRVKCHRTLLIYMICLSVLCLPIHSLHFVQTVSMLPDLLPECEGGSACEEVVEIYYRATLRHKEILVSLCSIIWSMISVHFLSANFNFPHGQVVFSIKANVFLLLISCALRTCYGARFLISNLIFIFGVGYFTYTGCVKKHQLELQNFILRSRLVNENSDLHFEVSKRDAEMTMHEEASDLVFLNSLAPIFSLDALGYVTMWNHGIAMLTKLTQISAVGRHISEMPFDSASQSMFSATLKSGASSTERIVSQSVSMELILVDEAANEAQTSVIHITAICFNCHDTQSDYRGVLYSGVVERITADELEISVDET